MKHQSLPEKQAAEDATRDIWDALRRGNRVRAVQTTGCRSRVNWRS
jgi:hypothetical protein